MPDFPWSRKQFLEKAKEAFLLNFYRLMASKGIAGHPVKPLTEKKKELDLIANTLARKIAKDRNKNKEGYKKFMAESDENILKTTIRDRERLDEAEKSLIAAGVGKNIQN
jgi:hypothetical protein